MTAKAKKVDKKAKKLKPENISCLALAIEVLTKATADKRLEIAMAHLEHLSLWQIDEVGKKLTAKKAITNVHALFAVFKSHEAKLKLAAALCNLPKFKMNDKPLFDIVSEIFINSLSQKLILMDLPDPENFALTQLSKIFDDMQKVKQAVAHLLNLPEYKNRHSLFHDSH